MNVNKTINFYDLEHFGSKKTIVICWKNWIISNSDGLGTMSFSETLVLFRNWIDEEQCWSIFWSNFFFCDLDDVKSSSLIRLYGTSTRALGRSQYAFSPVQVFASRILTCSSIKKRVAPICEQLSSRPAMQLQWDERIIPSAFAKIHVWVGVSRNLWEWFTWKIRGRYLVL